MPTIHPQIWKSASAAKERAEELQIALDQFQRKEINFKQLMQILQPEISARVRHVQDVQAAAGSPSTGTFEEQTERYINERLKTDQLIYTLLRTCLNDAEQAAGMWDRPSVQRVRPRMRDTQQR